MWLASTGRRRTASAPGEGSGIRPVVTDCCPFWVAGPTTALVAVLDRLLTWGAPGGAAVAEAAGTKSNAVAGVAEAALPARARAAALAQVLVGNTALADKLTELITANTTRTATSSSESGPRCCGRRRCAAGRPRRHASVRCPAGSTPIPGSKGRLTGVRRFPGGHPPGRSVVRRRVSGLRQHLGSGPAGRGRGGRRAARQGCPPSTRRPCCPRSLAPAGTILAPAVLTGV